MKRFFSSLAIWLLCLNSSSQNNPARNYFQKGIDSFNSKNYRNADSLFSLSLQVNPNADTYVNRAGAREKLGNKKGMCEDLMHAIKYFDKEADILFCNKCGSADTTYLSSDEKPATKENYFYKRIEYKSILTESFVMETDRNNNPFPARKLNPGTIPAPPIDTTKRVESMAEYPGGIQSMVQFMTKNVKYPKEAEKAEIKGKVYVKFIVTEDGSIGDVTVEKGIEKCPECDNEAVRVVKMMPKWKPAIMNGKPVKCRYNLPVVFKKG